MSIPTAQAFLYQAPAGVPGDVTRPGESKVEPAMLIAVSAVFAQAFGIPMKYATGGISQFSGSEAATAFAGILVREVPSVSGNSNQGLTNNIPNPLQVQGFLTQGFVSVVVAAGTPARGGVVYVQVTANGGVAVGAFRADGTDSGNAVALTNQQARWASDGLDSSGNAELQVQF